jgi:hypothetical protein
MSDARRQSLERMFLLNPAQNGVDQSLQQPIALAAGPAAPEKPQKTRNSERAADYFAQVGTCYGTLPGQMQSRQWGLSNAGGLEQHWSQKANDALVRRRLGMLFALFETTSQTCSRTT